MGGGGGLCGGGWGLVVQSILLVLNPYPMINDRCHRGRNEQFSSRIAGERLAV